MPHIVRCRPRKIGSGQIAEILLRLQNRRPRIINVEKILQPAEAIGRPHLLDTGKGNGNAIARRQSKHQFRLQRAFNMQMQLGLGNGGNQII